MGHAFRDEAGGFVTSAAVTGAIIAYSEVILPNLQLYRVKAAQKVGCSKFALQWRQLLVSRLTGQVQS
jgi:hypothetical protein